MGSSWLCSSAKRSLRQSVEFRLGQTLVTRALPSIDIYKLSVLSSARFSSYTTLSGRALMVLPGSLVRPVLQSPTLRGSRGL